MIKSKDSEMGRTCSTHGRDEKGIQNLVRKSKGRDQSEDLDIHGRIILKS
jgi:hypothetical protein